MKLVWSQPASAADRPRSLVLLGVVCIFFGGAVIGRPGPESPRAFRAAAASLVGTGLLVCIAGGVGLVFQRRRPGPPLTLADSSRSSSGSDGTAGLREEEQR